MKRMSINLDFTTFFCHHFFFSQRLCLQNHVLSAAYDEDGYRGMLPKLLNLQAGPIPNPPTAPN